MKSEYRKFVGVLFFVASFVFVIQIVLNRKTCTFFSWRCHFTTGRMFDDRMSVTVLPTATGRMFGDRMSVPVLPTPLCTRYDGASHNFSTQDLIVRAAYFDDRPRGNHRNSTVLLVEVRISILKQNRIVGCAVGKHATTAGPAAKVRPVRPWP